MDPSDEQRVAEAVRQAEAGTSAELVCVLAHSSSGYEFFPLVWAALAALATPWILIETTLLSVERIALAQLGVFVLVLLLLSIPPLRMRLVPRSLQRQRAHRAAAEQFLLRGLSHTKNRTGVLIFVSRAERYARVIADEGVASRVDPKRWQEAIDILLDDARRGRVADGFVAAVAHCGRVLAEHFPPGPDPVNELSDSLTVL